MDRSLLQLGVLAALCFFAAEQVFFALSFRMEEWVSFHLPLELGRGYSRFATGVTCLACVLWATTVKILKVLSPSTLYRYTWPDLLWLRAFEVGNRAEPVKVLGLLGFGWLTMGSDGVVLVALVRGKACGDAAAEAVAEIVARRSTDAGGGDVVAHLAESNNIEAADAAELLREYIAHADSAGEPVTKAAAARFVAGRVDESFA